MKTKMFFPNIIVSNFLLTILLSFVFISNTTLFSMEIEKIYDIGDSIAGYKINNENNSLQIFSKNKIYAIDYNTKNVTVEEIIDVKINIDSIVNVFNPELINEYKILSQNKNLIAIKYNDGRNGDYFVINIKKNTITKYNDVNVNGVLMYCNLSSFYTFYFLENKLIQSYNFFPRNSKFTCNDIWLVRNFENDTFSHYTPAPADQTFLYKSLPNSFNGHFVGINKKSEYKRQVSLPEGNGTHTYTDIMTLVKPNENVSSTVFNFVQTQRYSSGKLVETSPPYYNSVNNGFIGFNEGFYFIQINDLLYKKTYDNKVTIPIKLPLNKLSSVFYYYAGYNDEFIISYGIDTVGNKINYVIYESDVTTGLLNDSFTFLSINKNEKSPVIKLIGYNKDFNLIFVDYTNKKVYEINKYKSELENKKYAELLVNKPSIKTDEAFEYELKTSNIIKDFSAEIYDGNDNLIKSSNNSKDSVLGLITGNYVLKVKFKKDNDEIVKIQKYLYVRNNLICDFEVDNNIGPAPLKFKITNKSKGDIISTSLKLNDNAINFDNVSLNYEIKLPGKYPFTMTISDGVETISLTKYIYVTEDKLSNTFLTETKMNEIFTPFNKSPKVINGQNYFKLSDRDYKEFLYYSYDANGGTGNHYLSSFEQSDTSLIPNNNYVFDIYLGEKLYHIDKTKDTLVGLKISSNSSFNKIEFLIHYNNQKEYTKAVDLLTNYALIKYAVLNNKFVFILANGDGNFIAIVDNNYDLVSLQKLDLDLKVGYKENLTIDIDSQSDNIINLTILRHLDLYYKKISFYNNKFKIESSSNTKLTFLENSLFNRIGSLYNNMPYLLNLDKNDTTYQLYLFDENNIEKQTKVVIPLKIRSDGNFNYKVIDNKILFINSDTYQNKNYLYFDVFNFQTQQMISKQIEDRLVRISSINVYDDSVFISGNITTAPNKKTAYFAKTSFSNIGLSSIRINPDVRSQKYDYNSTINDLFFEFNYTSTNILKIKNQFDDLKTNIEIFDVNGTKVLNLGTLNINKGENQIDLNNLGLNYKVFFIKFESEGKISIYKFIYIN